MGILIPTSWFKMILKRNFILLEPVGAKGPTFSTQGTSISFTRYYGENVVLLCPAQAFPVPKFR